MRSILSRSLGVLLLVSCVAERPEPAAESTAAATQAPAPQAPAPSQTVEPAAQPETPASENEETNTWAGQVKVAEAESTFNYVGAESGDWVPMRFRNDSEAGKKILAACRNDDECEFTGAVEWLDEAPPPDASAVARIVRVDSVKRLPPGTP
jgi:hypothetical protein